MDGHKTHQTPKFVNFAREHKIILILFLAHSTHLFQVLDVLLFGRVKIDWGSVMAQHRRISRKKIDKFSFMELYPKAHVTAFTEDNIKAAWAKSGLWPLDPARIRDEQLRPAEETSTSADSIFPVAPPSPIKQLGQVIGIPYSRHHCHDTPDPAFGMRPPSVPPRTQDQTDTERGSPQTSQGSNEPGASLRTSSAIVIDPTLLDPPTPLRVRHAIEQVIPTFAYATDLPITPSKMPIRATFAQSPSLRKTNYSVCEFGDMDMDDVDEVREKLFEVRDELLHAKKREEISRDSRLRSNVFHALQGGETLRLKEQLNEKNEEEEDGVIIPLPPGTHVLTSEQSFKLVQERYEADCAREAAKKRKVEAKKNKEIFAKRKADAQQSARQDYEDALERW